MKDRVILFESGLSPNLGLFGAECVRCFCACFFIPFTDHFNEACTGDDTHNQSEYSVQLFEGTLYIIYYILLLLL